MIDWSYIGFAGSIFALGFIGFAGVTLLPLRSFHLLRRYAHSWRSSVWSRIALIMVAVAATAVAVYGGPSLCGYFTALPTCAAARIGPEV
jgi:hypothetical protein